jgi:hypothetical protein
MPEKKKQHFVSQFLLREFSVKDNPKVINLYNRLTDKFVENAPINTQAQEAYFYGVDTTFEDYLAHFEGKASTILKTVIKDKILPDYKHKDYGQLLHFIMLFAFRTKNSVNQTEERINSGFKELSKFIPDLKDIDFDKHRIVHPEPAAFNLASYMDNWVITYDLSSTLLVNNTEDDFFISDNPFTIYNPLMLKRQFYELANGLGNKGLVILFPISPKAYLMLYDSWVYQTTETEQVIELKNKTDIENINLLQSISADKIIYYSQTSDSNQVKRISTLALEHKTDDYINKVFEHPFKKGGKLMMSYYLEHKLTPDLTFIKENDSIQKINDWTTLSGLRNKEIEHWLTMDKSKLRNRKHV